MRRLTLIAILTLLLTACSPAAPIATVLPSPLPLTGSVVIDNPPDGAIIYSELLYMSGSAQSVPGNQFQIVLTGVDDQTIAQTTVQIGSDNKWKLELPHGYTGDPTEVTVTARANYPGAPADSDYADESIVLSSKDHRPEGTFGRITSPDEGSTVGGDMIQVTGTASGVFENQFTVEMLDDKGNSLARQAVALFNPYIIDEMPWTVQLSIGKYLGPAEIRVYTKSAKDGSDVPIASVKVTVTADAG